MNAPVDGGQGIVEPAEQAAAAAVPDLDGEVTVYPGGNRRGPARGRPFSRLMQAVRNLGAKADPAVIAAKGELDAVTQARDAAVSQAGEQAYEAAIADPRKAFEEAETAFEKAKQAARERNSRARKRYDEVYAASIDPETAEQRRILEERVKKAREAADDGGQKRKQLAEAAGAEIAGNEELSPEDLAARVKKAREDLNAERGKIVTSLMEAERALEDFNAIHAEDDILAKDTAKVAADKLKEGLVTKRNDTKTGLDKARAVLRDAEPGALEARKNAEAEAAAPFAPRVDEAEETYNTTLAEARATAKQEFNEALQETWQAVKEPVVVNAARLMRVGLRANNAFWNTLSGIGRNMREGWNMATALDQFSDVGQTREMLQKPAGELMEGIVKFDKDAAAELQAKFLALHKAQADKPAELRDNLYQIRDERSLNRLLVSNGVDEAAIDDAMREVNAKTGMPDGVPVFGKIATTFKLVDSGVNEALMTAQAGQRTAAAVERLQTLEWDRPQATPAAYVLNGTVFDRRDPSKPANSHIGKFANDPPSLVGAQATHHVAEMIHGMIYMKPELADGLGYRDIQNDLKQIASTALETASSELDVMGQDKASRRIGRVAKAVGTERVFGDPAARVKQFLDNGIADLQRSGVLNADEAARFQALADQRTMQMAAGLTKTADLDAGPRRDPTVERDRRQPTVVAG